MSLCKFREVEQRSVDYYVGNMYEGIILVQFNVPSSHSLHHFHIASSLPSQSHHNHILWCLFTLSPLSFPSSFLFPFTSMSITPRQNTVELLWQRHSVMFLLFLCAFNFLSDPKQWSPQCGLQCLKCQFQSMIQCISTYNLTIPATQ